MQDVRVRTHPASQTMKREQLGWLAFATPNQATHPVPYQVRLVPLTRETVPTKKDAAPNEWDEIDV